MDILEEEKLYFGRTRHPHCRTCVCPSNPVRVKSKTTLSSRRHHHHHHLSPPQDCAISSRRSHRSPTDCAISSRIARHHRSSPGSAVTSAECDVAPRRRHRSPPYRYPSADCAGKGPLESVWDSGPQQMRMPPPPGRMERRYHANHKFELLEKWFKRFDFDHNGHLDVFELRTLINVLGVSAGEDYCTKLLHRADRDGDGLLTFPEFLMMWRQAHDEDELLEIIREYDLYPDVVQVDTFRRQRLKQQVIETVKRRVGHQKQCCGCESTVTICRTTPDEDRIQYKAKVSHRSHEKLPIFSCYR